MSEPSKTAAYTDIALGAAKENVGWAVRNEQMEAEGLAVKEKGNAELQAAKAEQRLIATKDQVKGNIKEAAGNLLGNEQWHVEGKVAQLKGDARQAANL
ncbi:DNA binding protein [Acanthamoeba castellanii str. Neff]|uniref:DNA binding protein n=1 Tax=Acanthamoeba castellanii (strain ATCC 30010 / Neff) TaxID=1257118 RepID=L8GY62_ACACF|nr:DNA binding protein [Acanthamoeba castellanii str. Neff]ELR18189.1 DNA binding protein [Acanthamoeba castellanii str. Neff]